MIKIATLIYYFIVVAVSASLALHFSITDWQWWVVIGGLIGARLCGQAEEC